MSCIALLRYVLQPNLKPPTIKTIVIYSGGLILCIDLISYRKYEYNKITNFLLQGLKYCTERNLQLNIKKKVVGDLY